LGCWAIGLDVKEVANKGLDEVVFYLCLTGNQADVMAAGSAATAAELRFSSEKKRGTCA
jgi:hypothetical protein